MWHQNQLLRIHTTIESDTIWLGKKLKTNYFDKSTLELIHNSENIALNKIKTKDQYWILMNINIPSSRKNEK